MNEQTDMHNPDADKKTIGKGRKKNLNLLFRLQRANLIRLLYL